VHKTWENQWGRGVLLNFLESDLYEREGAALSNFQLALPALSRINAPIGISEYELAKQQLPKDMQSALPTTEEIESKLNDNK